MCATPFFQFKVFNIAGQKKIVVETTSSVQYMNMITLFNLYSVQYTHFKLRIQQLAYLVVKVGWLSIKRQKSLILKKTIFMAATN